MASEERKPVVFAPEEPVDAVRDAHPCEEPAVGLYLLPVPPA
jgi:hypothetical protein